MSLLRTVALLETDLPWRPTTMPDATPGVSMVRTDVAGATGVYVRFPAGCRRLVPGGYASAEEFFVVEGDLELNGTAYGPGDLTHVPAHVVRRSMSTEHGAMVLAWFGGPIEWVRQPALRPTEETIRSVRTHGVGSGPVMRTSEAVWRISTDGSGGTDDADGIVLPRGPWGRLTDLAAPAGIPVLLRTPRSHPTS